MNNVETRERLLDAAEHLFAEHGLEGPSLRSITAAAGTNLASVHYHFGSKDALVRAVFARRLEPLNEERIRLLAAAEDTAEGGSPALEAIVEAFVAPTLRLIRDPAHGGKDFMCLMAQMHAETSELRLAIVEEFDNLLRRFADALSRTLPHLPRAEVFWRFAFMLGSMAFVLGHADTLKTKSNGLCDPSDVEGAIQRLVAFVSAGMRAPVPDVDGGKS